MRSGSMATATAFRRNMNFVQGIVGKPCSDKPEDQQTQTTPTTAQTSSERSSIGFDIAPTIRFVARIDYISGKVSIEIDHHGYNGAFRLWSSSGHAVVSFITWNWQQTTTAGTRSNNRMSSPLQNQHVCLFLLSNNRL
jgi:hypothetical protein